MSTVAKTKSKVRVTMRTTQAEKTRLRDEILKEAIPFLKKSGLEGAPVDQIMKQAGLTSGALYSHFESKDDLFVQATLNELGRSIAYHRKQQAELGSSALRHFIATYLSEGHLHAIGKGCVFVALGADIQRQKPKVKALFEEKITELFEILSRSIQGKNADEKLAKVQFIFSSLIGAVVLARSTGSSGAKMILENTKIQLLKLLAEKGHYEHTK